MVGVVASPRRLELPRRIPPRRACGRHRAPSAPSSTSTPLRKLFDFGLRVFLPAPRDPVFCIATWSWSGLPLKASSYPPSLPPVGTIKSVFFFFAPCPSPFVCSCLPRPRPLDMLGRCVQQSGTSHNGAGMGHDPLQERRRTRRDGLDGPYWLPEILDRPSCRRRFSQTCGRLPAPRRSRSPHAERVSIRSAPPYPPSESRPPPRTWREAERKNIRALQPQISSRLLGSASVNIEEPSTGRRGTCA